MTPVNLTSLKRLLAVISCGVLTSLSAWADDPVNGATIYHSTNSATGCAVSGCHNANPLTSNGSKIYNARNARAVIQSAISNNTGGMGRLSLTAQQVADVAAYVGNTPTTLTFPSTNVGSTSATQQVTVYASLKSGSSLSALSISTTGDFARSGGTCATTVGTGLNCTILVNFTPTASGARTGTLSISHNRTLTPITIALSGTGSGAVTPAPVAGISPTSLSFGSVAIGSAGTAQSVTVSNTGNAALSIASITPSNSNFTIAGGTCSAGGSVAAGGSCTVSVSFTPIAGTTGARTGTLSIAHNAASSPGTVSLSGTATAAPAPTTALTSTLAFGSRNVASTSTAQTATLSNTGTAALSIGTLSTGSTEFVITGGTCAAGGTVAVGSSCTVTLTFTPSTAGARSATLTVTHNTTTSATTSTTASLSGTGVALSPVIGVSPTSLSFNQVVSTTSAAQTVTISNTGTASLSISALTLGGAQAADFQRTGASTCAAGGTVAVNASCTVLITFTPAATGARAGTLSITHNASGSQSTVTLSGTGTAAPQPAISLSASTLAFGSQTQGTTSATRTVTVTNSGAATLTFNALTLTGTASADFTRSGTCTASGTLATGASCTVIYTFTPAAVGARTATLTVGSDASNGSAAVSLSGTGTAIPTPVVGLSPASLAFGNQTQNTVSTLRTATLSNSGSGALSISGITASSGFGVTHNCGSSLAAGGSCTLSATFSPTALGAVSGSISVASNAAGSPHSLSLTGTGVVSSPVLAWVPTTTSVDFGNQTVGAASSAQTVTLLNQGPGAVTLSAFTLAGTQLADFSVSSGGTCAVNVSLASGSSCTLPLAFSPSAVGARSATLQVASTGTSPPDLALSGNGTAPAQPAVTISPTALSFTAAAGAAASDQTLTLQSTGNAALQVTAMSIASGSFTMAPAETGGCSTPPFALQPGQSCSVSIAWSSSATGSETGSVQIDTDASSTPAVVALQATRDAAVAPSATPGMSNSGGGGCSIADGKSLTDPTLLLLLALAGVVLWRRRPSQR